MATRVYDDEVAEMIELAEKGYNVSEIARTLRRDPATIAQHLAPLKPTGILARRYYEAQQYQLAQRAVEKANVDQILEIHDRLDVLPRKTREGNTGPSVLVCVGMPGQPALPVPTPAQLRGEVIDAPSTNVVPSTPLPRAIAAPPGTRRAGIGQRAGRESDQPQQSQGDAQTRDRPRQAAHAQTEGPVRADRGRTRAK